MEGRGARQVVGAERDVSEHALSPSNAFCFFGSESVGGRLKQRCLPRGSHALEDC
jgi:hypothetical protein